MPVYDYNNNEMVVDVLLNNDYYSSILNAEKEGGVFLPKKVYQYSGYEYNSEITLNLLKDINSIENSVKDININDIIKYFTECISDETKYYFGEITYLVPNYFPNIENLTDSVAYIINRIKNIIKTICLIDSEYNDISLRFNGRNYFLLSQYAYANYDDWVNLNEEEKHSLRDGGILFNMGNVYAFSSDKWDIARSSCSACATFNAVFNLLTPSEVINFISNNNNLQEYTIKYNSINAGIILGINDLLYEKIEDGTFDQRELTNKRYLVTSELVENCFGDQLKSTIIDKSDYLDDKIVIGDEIIKRDELYSLISNHETTMVVRLNANSGRYATDSGHYVTIIDYMKNENNDEFVFVADSAIPIPERSASSYLAGTDSNRTGWVPLSAIESCLRNDNTFTIIQRTEG